MCCYCLLQLLNKHLSGVTIVLGVGTQRQSKEGHALKMHRILIGVLGVVDNLASVHPMGWLWSPEHTALLDVKMQIWCQVFQRLSPKPHVHSGDIRKPKFSSIIEELLEMDTSRAPAFISYLLKKKYILIVNSIIDIFHSNPHPLIRHSLLSSQLLLLKHFWPALLQSNQEI